jgi:hypothetical protein
MGCGRRSTCQLCFERELRSRDGSMIVAATGFLSSNIAPWLNQFEQVGKLSSLSHPSVSRKI